MNKQEISAANHKAANEMGMSLHQYFTWLKIHHKPYGYYTSQPVPPKHITETAKQAEIITKELEGLKDGK